MSGVTMKIGKSKKGAKPKALGFRASAFQEDEGGDDTDDGLRTEIVPISGDWSKTDEMRMRLMCQLAGESDRWYSKQEIEVFSPRVRR